MFDVNDVGDDKEINEPKDEKVSEIEDDSESEKTENYRKSNYINISRAAVASVRFSAS